MSHPVSEPFVLSVNIASGSALSDSIHCGDAIPQAFYIPTIDSAKLTFQASVDGSTWYECNDSTNSTITEPTTSGDIYLTAPDGLEGANYLKIRTGTSGSPTNQSSDRTITVVCK